MVVVVVVLVLVVVVVAVLASTSCHKLTVAHAAHEFVQVRSQEADEVDDPVEPGSTAMSAQFQNSSPNFSALQPRLTRQRLPVRPPHAPSDRCPKV